MNLTIKLSLVFIFVFFIGYVLTFLIYRKRGKKFSGSAIQTKIVFWVPIFLFFMAYINFGFINQLIITLFVISGAFLDLIDRLKNFKNNIFVVTFFIFICLGILSGLILYNINSHLLIATVFSSVISDVFAYFFGILSGKYELPKPLNHKTYDGVLGQFLGALVGLLLINLFIFNISLFWFFLIGLGNVIGDLSNSILKRTGYFKDWSDRIPGHGGFIDRFCSLSVSLLLILCADIIF